MAASGAENSTPQSPSHADRLPLAQPALQDSEHSGSERLKILRPKFGEIVSGTTTVKTTVAVGNDIRPESVQITLNGKKVHEAQIQKGQCSDNQCEWSVGLTKKNRLLSGANEIRVSARNSRNRIKLASVDFDYNYGLKSGQNLGNYLPKAVGLSLAQDGTNPWVTLTTGTPANLQDNLDPTKYVLPYHDTTFPGSNDTACTSRYQVVVLNRYTPAIEDGYYCANDSTSLKSYLAGLSQGTELVLVGTTGNNVADSALDTSGIGGADYSKYQAAWQPQGYAAIGVPGAQPGSAYENYYLAGDVGKPYQRTPFANGILAVDGSGYYNFHAANNAQFEVYPNNPLFSASSVAISNNGSTLTWLPPVGSANGVWLLVLDRVTLEPIDLTNQGSCGGGSVFCGTFYQTGNSDTTVASQATTSLYEALAQPTSRQLVVLTTVGQPFQSAANAAFLAPAIAWFGGAGYRFEILTTPTSTYTLISPGAKNQTGTWPPGVKSPFSTGIVNSSTVFSLGQGNEHRQTGIVRGVMTCDRNSLYFPSVVSQYDPSVDQSGNPTTLNVDYDFYTISTQMPTDWPLTDSSGHIAAYHFISGQFLLNHFAETGSYSADLRYFYTSPGDVTKIGSYNTDFLCSEHPTLTNCVYPGDDQGFTQQDLADANAQLYLETTALGDTDAYLGDNGIGGVIKGTTQGAGLSDQVITATYEVLNGQMGALPGTSVGANSFDWMNFLAGLTSVGAAALGPADVPFAAAAVGVTSGMLWSGSALDPWWQAGGSNTPLSYENTFDTTLGNLEENENTYATNLATSYGTALDDIYTDWGKLSATGAKTADSNSGWSFSDEVTSITVAGQLTDGVRRSIYTQLLPKFYSQDSYYAQPVANTSQLGTFDSYAFGEYKKLFYNSCYSSYQSDTTSNPFAASVFGSTQDITKSDMFVMGGTINDQNTPKVTENMPSNQLLNTLFGINTVAGQGPLNIPQELVYGTVALPARSGPSMGNYDGITQCYKPGCSDTTTDPTQSSCIAP